MLEQERVRPGTAWQPKRLPSRGARRVSAPPQELTRPRENSQALMSQFRSDDQHDLLVPTAGAGFSEKVTR